VEVLKQLEDRTKVAKENIFRQKKELNRLNTDLEEDTRRVEAIKLQNTKNNDLKEHLKGIQINLKHFKSP
jgi:small-conductance mechanosensitive channel